MKKENIVSIIVIIISIPLIIGIAYYGKIYIPEKRRQDRQAQTKQQYAQFCSNRAKNLFEIDRKIWNSIKPVILTKKFNAELAKSALGYVPNISNEFAYCSRENGYVEKYIGYSEREKYVALIKFHYELKELLEGRIEIEENILALPENEKQDYKKYLPKFLRDKINEIEKNYTIIEDHSF